MDWRFPFNILEAFELPSNLLNWIRICVSSPHYSIALNGELASFFPEKGLRQGDPISSSLFVIVMDVFSKQLDRAALLHQFVPHPRASDLLVIHLNFTMICSDFLMCFRFFGGNYCHSKLFLSLFWFGFKLKQKNFVGWECNNFERDRFGLVSVFLPVKDLGLPLMPNKMKRGDYQPLIDKFTKRISSWTYKHLSFAGRLQLIKSVLYIIFNFGQLFFLYLRGVLIVLKKICNAFL